MITVTGKRNPFSTPATRNASRDTAALIGRVQAAASNVSAERIQTVLDSPWSPPIAVVGFYALLSVIVPAIESIKL